MSFRPQGYLFSNFHISTTLNVTISTFHSSLSTYHLSTALNVTFLNTHNYSRLTTLSTLQASGFSLKRTLVSAQTLLKSSEFL